MHSFGKTFNGISSIFNRSSRRCSPLRLTLRPNSSPLQQTRKVSNLRHIHYLLPENNGFYQFRLFSDKTSSSHSEVIHHNETHHQQASSSEHVHEEGPYGILWGKKPEDPANLETWEIPSVYVAIIFTVGALIIALSNNEKNVNSDEYKRLLNNEFLKELDIEKEKMKERARKELELISSHEKEHQVHEH